MKRKKKENIERLTFAEIVNIVDGQVLGGKTGLHKTLTKFVIGAMQLEDMMRYTDAGSLLIVGNRIKAHENALRAGAAVLITGGFDTTDDNKQLADALDLPIISTSYDTFTVATMINRAIYDQLIKKDILFIEDIYVPMVETSVLRNDETIHHFHKLNKSSVKGICAWVIFIEEEDQIRVRLRSKGSAIINTLAKEFNGGGHPLASGATAYSWQEAERVTARLQEICQSYHS
ncbi:hypothetical protein LSPH24S_09454 [Lysinibacillus sphaericus]